MKVVPPKPFTYRGGAKAVLLLHGFTGSPVDVRNLGRYLSQRGYTCHAPMYQGHGADPEALLASEPDEWWEDVKDGYQLLLAEGFSQVAVAGVSLGGVFSLKAAAELPVAGVVSMCAPMQAKSIEDLSLRVTQYAKQYKKFEGKGDAQIAGELEELERTPMPFLKQIQRTIVETSGKLGAILSPAMVMQGMLDDVLYRESAPLIYRSVGSEQKQLKWYDQSGHILTLGKEREQVYEDVHTFLETLSW
ncbi:carboxylesterase [Paenibacillus sp. J31TS4]|uniref:alpha/beta hydrolase n=1 Tax=Paenibacillus sp. J31TS4 TaxID=2807195 RepID=UPI001B054221|nr:alpha/beta fold hydrolase [Paenibacillus sp. J31TS4]GIP38977.1 carboxylesterase [Paenibacillus sp. J31TS4]